MKYEINIKTGYVEFGGTNATVFITLHGSEKKSNELEINGTFERGDLDIYTVTLDDSGEINSITMRHDNSEISSPFDGGASWYVDYVIIKNLTSSEEFYFPCYRWLADNRDDNQIERSFIRAYNPKNYDVEVHTDDAINGGTDGDVYLTIHGSSYTIKNVLLDNKENNFEKNKLDKFQFKFEDLGDIMSIIVKIINGDDKWVLCKIKIKSSDNIIWEFDCNHKFVNGHIEEEKLWEFKK